MNTRFRLRWQPWMGVLGLAIAAISGPVAGQTPAADYSKGFARFYALGLPVLTTNAAYVKLEVWMDYMQFGRDLSFSDLKQEGNAWMLTQDPAEGKAWFVADYCRRVEVYDQKTLLAKRNAKMKEERAKTKNAKTLAAKISAWMMDDQDRKPAGQWKPADPKKDIARIIEFLKKRSATGSARYDPLKAYSGYGALLLAAIHFHRMGYTHEANEIVGLLFEVSQDQRLVLTQGLGRLADACYSDITDAFFATGDWNAYAQALHSLLTEFSTSWDKSPAVQRLAERVTARAAQKQAPPIAGEDLTDEDRQLANELAAATNLNRSLMAGMLRGQNWILPDPSLAQHLPPGSSNVLSRILDRGIKSVPLLLALVKDDRMTMVNIQSLNRTSFTSFSDDEGMTEERIQQTYDSLQRPASRSEIAVMLLAPLLKQEDDLRGNRPKPTRDEIHEQAAAFYAAHKNQSPAELAHYFLKEGDDNQRNMAIHLLIQSGGTQDVAAIEGFLLNPDNLMRRLQLASMYVMQRKEKAKDFVGHYADLLNQQMTNTSDNEMFKRDDFKQAVERNLTQMQLMTAAPKPFAEILDKITAGTNDWDISATGLYQAMQGKKPDELLPPLLSAAGKATNADLRIKLIGMTMAATHMQNAEEEEEEIPPPLDIAKTAALWKPLLADNRAAETETPFSDRLGTVGDTAAQAIEMLYSDEAQMDPYARYWSQGPKIARVMKARAEARLAGKKAGELPPLPSADKVSKAERKKIVDQLLRTKADELAAQIKALGPDSLAALGEEADDNTVLSAKLAPLANTITEVAFKPHKGEKATELDALKGKQLDKIQIELLLGVCRRFTEEGKPCYLAIKRQADLDGTTVRMQVLSATNMSADTRQYFGHFSFGSNKKAMINALLHGPELNAGAMWFVEQKASPAPGTNTPAAQAHETDELTEKDMLEEASASMNERLAEQQLEFWKTAEELCQGSGNSCQAAAIMFFGVPVLPEGAKTQGNVRNRTRFSSGEGIIE